MTTPITGSRRASQTKPKALTAQRRRPPRRSSTSTSSTSASASTTNAAHSQRRGRSSNAVALKMAVPRAMKPPSVFFSSHKPRQAPGKMLSIRPISGRKTPAARLATASTAKHVASTWARRTQSKRAAIITPPERGEHDRHRPPCGLRGIHRPQDRRCGQAHDHHQQRGFDERAQALAPAAGHHQERRGISRVVERADHPGVLDARVVLGEGREPRLGIDQQHQHRQREHDPAPEPARLRAPPALRLCCVPRAARASAADVRRRRRGFRRAGSSRRAPSRRLGSQAHPVEHQARPPCRRRARCASRRSAASAASVSSAASTITLAST